MSINTVNTIINELGILSADIAEIDLLLSRIEEGNEAQIEAKFAELFRSYKCNPLMLHRFLIYLQINNSISIKKYDLSDVKLLFDESCKVYTDAIELNLERYYFYFKILDKESLALNELNLFINNVTKMDKERILKVELNPNNSV